jgi:fibro-slime domain-containing protein
MKYTIKIILLLLVVTFSIEAEEIQLTGTLRDFHSSHPDFQLYDVYGNWDFAGLDQGIVEEQLGADKKPVYKGRFWTSMIMGGYWTDTKSTSNETNFNQWYRDVSGINQSMDYTITLQKQGSVYVYDSEVNPVGDTGTAHDGFFPLDHQLFGNEENSEHNYHLTYEVHSSFTYQGGEIFEFSGDDDVWVFINGQLVIDIGGVHSRIEDSVNLDTLNLTVGETYDFDMFWAERHTVESNFKITTSIELDSQGDCTEEIQTIQRVVSSDNDDAEERVSNGDMYRSSSDLEMTRDGHEQIVGIRFRDISIPKGATITNAYIQFTADETDSESTNLTIHGEDSDNALAFSGVDYDISSRAKTSSSISWSPPAWNSVGEQGSKQRTGDLSSVVQEIVSRGGWSSGNSMAFIISGTGKRVADSYYGTAPILHIEYMGCPQENNSSSTAMCYALTDNSDRLYKVTMSPNGDPLPTPTIVNISTTFNGEGSAYRASDNKFYAFKANGDDSGPSDLYTIDVDTGATQKIVDNIISGAVDGAEFYFDPTLNKEILYIISGEYHSKLYAFDPDGWTPLAGYPKNTNTNLSSLAINPITGDAYAIDDYNYDNQQPKVYTLNLKTGATTHIATLQNLADAEGLAYASDGNLYIEDEGRDDLEGKKLYMVNLQTGELTPSAFTNANGDIEGLSCNGTQMAIEYPTIKIDANSSVVEGNSNTTDLNFLVTLSKPAVKDIILSYAITDETTVAGEDYIVESNKSIIIPKDAESATITIKIKGDEEVENNETFIINLIDAQNGVIDNSGMRGTIINDDSLCKVSIFDANVTEGDSGTTEITFDITLDKPAPNGGLTIQIEPTDITANEGEDYTRVTSSIYFAQNETNKTISYLVNGDTEIEDNETFSVDILQSESFDIDPLNASAIGTIINDDEETPLPIAEYRFDNCSWSGIADEVRDSSGNMLHGRAKHSATTSVDALINRSANFVKSSSQYAEINGFDSIFGTSSSEFTITTWIKPKTLSNSKTNHDTKNTFLAKASDPKNDNIEIGVNPNGTLHLYLDTKTKDKYADFGDVGDINTNEWNFIAVRYRDGEVTIQINDKSYTNNTTWAGATIIDQAVGSPLTVGASIHVDNFFDGKIDELKIFDSFVSDNAVQNIYTNEQDTKNWDGTNRDAVVCPMRLEAEYRFDECSWGTSIGEVKDSKGTHHLTATNSANTIESGKILRAGSFDGVSQSVRGDTDIVLEDELTVNLWLNTTHNQAGANYARVLELSKTGNATYGTVLAYSTDGKTIRGWTTNNSNNRSSTLSYDLEANGVHNGDWHMVTFTYKRGVVKLYIDGSLKQSDNGNNIGDIADGKKLSIGGYYDNSNYMFNGLIDEVKIFSKALDVDEITLLKDETAQDRNSSACENIHYISGKVYQDENLNGSFDDADIPMANIGVTLFADTNGNGVYDEGIDTEESSSSTLANGEYRFVNLHTGKYIVVVDSSDSDITSGYVIDSISHIAINLVADSLNNNFKFIREPSAPINCVEDGLMFQNRPTDISYLDLTNGVMRVESENLSPDNINGAGYNKKDGYYWGYNYTRGDGTISRIGTISTGELVVDHYKIPNLDISSYTGDIDDNGHFYIKQAGNSKNVSVVDLDPQSEHYLQKIRDFELEDYLGIADWAFNPEDDKLYAVSGTYLYKIDPSNGDFISIQDVNITGSGGYGASFFDKNGFYYIYRNNSGEIFRIDVDAEHPQAVPFATGESVSLNDGAMCTDVDIRFDFGDLPAKYATKLESDGARHRIRTSVGETHYLGYDVSTENNGKPSDSANRDEYDDGVRVGVSFFGSVSLQGYEIKSKASLANLSIKTVGNGYLNAWIDWNRDGEFNASEQIADGIDGSSGTINLHILPDDIPQILFNGEPIYARFRYSSVEELNATGVAPDGEVEDYRMETPLYPTVHIEDEVSHFEGDEGETEFRFRVDIDRAGNPMDMMNSGFYFTVTDGTATTEDSDYQAEAEVDGALMQMGGFVMVMPTDDHFDIIVKVNGDTKMEGDEQFYLNLYSPAFMNIIRNRAVGVIKNDDSLILNIERTNSDTVDNSTQAQKESFYTQISGRDFDYAIVAYDKNRDAQPISNTTVKVELLDRNSTEENNVIYEYYHYIEGIGDRFNITNSDDLIFPIATREAQFRVSYLADENDTLIRGNFNSAVEYNATKSADGNREVVYLSDSFAIRPASYRMEIADLDESNSSISYRINSTTYSNPLKLVAEHDYRLKVDALRYNSEERALKYRQTKSGELDTNLIFDRSSNGDCNIDANISKNYKFSNGRFDSILSHNNVGKYTLRIEDSNWTAVDMNFNPMLAGCIANDSTISTDGDTKSGCNIASNFDDTHQDIKLSFQPFRFDMSGTSLANVNGDGKDFLYMSDLRLSRDMGVRLSSNIIAEGENGTRLTNFTKSCMDSSARLSLSLDFSFLSDRGLFDRTNYVSPKSITGQELTPQQIVEFNGEVNNSVITENSLDITNQFLDENNGTMSVDIIYNMEKLFSEPTNPIKVNFKSLELNSTNLEARTGEVDNTPTGIGSLDDNRTFYFARIASYLKNYPKTEKKAIHTPLFVEIFCKFPNDNTWCIDTMNLGEVGRRINQKTTRGWYRAVGHDSAIDGRVYRLVSDNPEINATNPVPDFNKGRINNISTNYVSNSSLIGDVKAEIAIDTDVWLRFNRRAIAGMPLGTSSYSVTIKSLSSITGLGNTGNQMQSVQRIEHNGKMSW